MKKHILLLWLMTGSLAALAQRGWELGGWAGASYYFGDLNTHFDLSTPGLAAGLIARYNFNDRICFKVSGNWGNISADDKNSPNVFERRRNLNFKSRILDGTGQVEFNFLPYLHDNPDYFFSPYIFAGLTVFNYNPTTEYNGKTVELAPLGTEGQFRGNEYYTTQVGLAYGGGIKMNLNTSWSLNLEFSFRRLFTDYLDDVSTSYPNLKDLEKLRGKTAAALSDRSVPGPDGLKLGETGRQRGNSKSRDMYAFVSLGIVHYFGNLECPKFK